MNEPVINLPSPHDCIELGGWLFGLAAGIEQSSPNAAPRLRRIANDLDKLSKALDVARAATSAERELVAKAKAVGDSRLVDLMQRIVDAAGDDWDANDEWSWEQVVETVAALRDAGRAVRSELDRAGVPQVDEKRNRALLTTTQRVEWLNNENTRLCGQADASGRVAREHIDQFDKARHERDQLAAAVHIVRDRLGAEQDHDMSRDERRALHKWALDQLQQPAGKDALVRAWERAEKAERDADSHRSAMQSILTDGERERDQIREHLAQANSRILDLERVRDEVYKHRDQLRAHVAVLLDWADSAGHHDARYESLRAELRDQGKRMVGGRFYLLSLKHSRGDFLTWWRPDERGYCWGLNVAGLYDEAKAREIERLSTHNGVRATVAVPEDIARSVAYGVIEAGPTFLERLGTSIAEWHKAARL